MNSEKLVTRDELLGTVFSDEARPCLRTFETWRRRKVIPFVRVGRKIFFDPGAVRQALATRFTITGARQ
jgi:hypothetical protein